MINQLKNKELRVENGVVLFNVWRPRRATLGAWTWSLC